jgi:transcriptional regulator with XRE-family HTH domain
MLQSECSLGVVVRERRLELGWTQEQLAEQISIYGEYVRQSEISRLENGWVQLPRRERLEKLAAALDLPLGELLARSGWANRRHVSPKPATLGSRPATRYDAETATTLVSGREYVILNTDAPKQVEIGEVDRSSALVNAAGRD